MARKRTAGPQGAPGDRTPPKRSRLRLNTLSDVKRALARVIRDCRSGLLDVTAGTKLAYMFSVQAQVCINEVRLGREDAFEARLAAAEELLAQQQPETGKGRSWSHARH